MAHNVELNVPLNKKPIEDMKMGKFILLFVVLLAALLAGCEKEDACPCYYSEKHHQWIPDGMKEQSLEGMTGERKAALNAECRYKEC